MATKLDGYKTYIILFLLIGLVIAQASVAGFTLPEWVIPTLAGVGGITLRHAISNNQTKE